MTNIEDEEQTVYYQHLRRLGFSEQEALAEVLLQAVADLKQVELEGDHDGN